ncbi:protein SPEAR1-like [Cucurbita pepo subsp. pepo]|uniref:protein SPEAR1-like n=1 Tax=Cucurbita pepo subsp. pepo TaxID=3664 RepID=UPI000C9D7839|nr:protein SPEAR1-like [Cucurbita pepo subsp. pepo]
MGSGYFGEMNMGNNNIDKRRSGSPSSAAAVATVVRRGRKGGGGGEKPKQPQRGLGVAQLEKIRLHGEMGCAAYGHPYPNLSASDDMRIETASSSSPSYGFYQTFMGMGEHERGSFGYGDFQPTTSLRWDPTHTFLETQHFGQPNMTGHLFNTHLQDSKYGSDSMGLSSKNSESSELDLELRLSI